MNILYITYDGLTDFIGQSQVLPYLIGYAADGHRLIVISFEKPARRELIGEQVAQQCREAGIDWRPQKFRSSPPYLAKAIDQQTMRRAATEASVGTSFDLVHCRSYPAAVAGLSIKQRLGVPLLFDMRGFWPDQRREGGRWRQSSPIGRWLFQRWKQHEARLIAAADHIVVLTQSAKQEIQQWPAYRSAPISVIPCCADFDHFTVAEPTDAQEARQKLGIPLDAPVLGYLGSLGTVYMIADHLRLYAAIKHCDPRAKALFIGRDEVSEIMSIAAGCGVDLAVDDLRVVAAERNDVPYWLGATDVGSCFIVPRYSSKGVSPTKLAEYLACGIPVIANRSVGDVEDIVEQLNAGHVMPDLIDDSIEAAADAFFSLRTMDRHRLRERAKAFDLPHAIQAYRTIYRHLGAAVYAGLQ